MVLNALLIKYDRNNRVKQHCFVTGESALPGSSTCVGYLLTKISSVYDELDDKFDDDDCC